MLRFVVSMFLLSTSIGCVNEKQEDNKHNDAETVSLSDKSDLESNVLEDDTSTPHHQIEVLSEVKQPAAKVLEVETLEPVYAAPDPNPTSTITTLNLELQEELLSDASGGVMLSADEAVEGESAGNGGLTPTVSDFDSTLLDDTLLANADRLSVNEDGEITGFDLLANDIDLSAASLKVAGFSQGVQGGRVSQDVNGLFQYFPPPDFFGIDTFSYEVVNDRGENRFADVTVEIQPIDDFPIANADHIVVSPLSSHTIDVLLNDSGLGDGVEITIVSEPLNSSVDVVNNQIVYQGNTEVNGQESFIYQITDSDGDIAIASVLISYTCEKACSEVLSLSWQPSISVNIKGYMIHVGTQPGQYDESIYVGDVTQYEYLVEPIGGYYFAISAINYDGVKSELSESAQKLF